MLTRLVQVFSSLLTDRAKYTGHGRRIRLSAQCRIDEGVVTIRDNGIGIPARRLKLSE